jgi:hypothetical protein
MSSDRWIQTILPTPKTAPYDKSPSVGLNGSRMPSRATRSGDPVRT